MSSSYLDSEPPDERFPLPLMPVTTSGSAFVPTSSFVVVPIAARRRRDYHRRKIEDGPVHAQVVPPALQPRHRLGDVTDRRIIRFIRQAANLGERTTPLRSIYSFHVVLTSSIFERISFPNRLSSPLFSYFRSRLRNW
jgi:hypothetical protein